MPSAAMKKEIWRADLLSRLQDIHFPKLEIGLPSRGEHEGAVAEWMPSAHSNYFFWFTLYVGDDPKAHVYCDPSLSGSTTGWLSFRLIRNEEALAKLPFTVEQWAVEDLRKKTTHATYRPVIRELLRHHPPRDLEEAWAALRRQLVGVHHYELHGDTAAYDESLMAALR